MSTETKLLIQKAKEVSLNSYSPYSKFKVGVAFSDESGNVFTGCNVENLAFPSGICAEQAAISKGVSEIGSKLKIKTLVVYTPTNQVTSPCGGCRQVISEFATSETRIICVCDNDEKLDTSFTTLFPESTVIKGLT